MKLILAGVLCLTAALAFDNYVQRKRLAYVAERCVSILLARPACVGFGP